MIRAVSLAFCEVLFHVLIFQIASMMGGSKAHTTHRYQTKSLSVDGFTSRSREQERAEKDLDFAQSEDNYDGILDKLLVEHEKELQQQYDKYNKLESEHRNVYKDNGRLRDQRGDLQEKCAGLEKQGEEMQEQQTRLQEKLNGWSTDYNKLERQFKAADSRYAYLLDKVVKPYAQSIGFEWNDQTAETIDVVVDPLAADALEARQLRDQVAVLQKDMLSRVEKVEATSDEQLAQDFRNLAALIKTLSRKMRFTDEVNVSKILRSPVLLHGVAVHYWDSRARKKCMIEAWIWSVLLYFVFGTPFDIFGKEGEALKGSWADLFGTEHTQSWPLPSPLSELWRCTTMESLVGSLVPRDVITHGKVNDKQSTIEASVLDARNNVASILKQVLAKVSPSADFGCTRQIVDKAFALAAQMSLQRARLQVTYPVVTVKFDKNTMSSMPDTNGKDIEDGIISSIVAPGLTKWGDAHGKHLEHRYDIVPALVQLEAVVAEPETELEKLWADVVKGGS
jgi:hypothetical protein